MLELLEIFVATVLEGDIIGIGSKIHQFDLTIEGYSYIMESEVAVWDSHIIKESIDPKKLLNILVHIFTVCFEHFLLWIEGLGEVLKR